MYSLKFVIHDVTSITILILRLYEVLYDSLDLTRAFGEANQSIDHSIINSETFNELVPRVYDSQKLAIRTVYNPVVEISAVSS